MRRVVYESGSRRQAPEAKGRCLLLTGTIFLVFCMVVYIYWPEGKMLLQTLLIPGDPETTLQAAEVFAAELGSGYSIPDAVRNFCDAVMAHGYPG